MPPSIHVNLRNFVSSIFLLGQLLACSGGSDDSPSQGGINTNTGVLLDSPVSGVSYVTATQSGTTDAQGQYSYVTGETVTFSIGDIIFPPTDATATVTPLDMVGITDLTNTSVLNILRLLQSLDVDSDPTNGIEISPIAHTEASGLSIDFSSASFDTDVANLVANSGSSTSTLVDQNTAISHFQTTLQSQPMDLASYLNYADNRQWNYSGNFGANGSGPPASFYEYTIEATVNDYEVYIYSWDPIWAQGAKEYILRDFSNGLTHIGHHQEPDDYFFDPPLVSPCQKLYETCVFKLTLGTSGITLDREQIMVLDSITVPAGTYNNCVKSSYTDNANGEIRHRWYCKDVGKVKEQKIDSDKIGGFVVELVSITEYSP